MLLPLGPPAQAAARPAFQAPFQCGRQIRMESFGHAPALDIFRVPTSATEGEPLIAPAAGRVNQSYSNPSGAGNIIQIDHGGGWFTTYIHLQSRAVGVGAQVAAGTPIGRVGHTGETSNGVSHLHFEMAVDRNGDGRAEWGYPNDERVAPVFNGVTYGQSNNGTWYVTSANCGTRPDGPGLFRPSTKTWYRPGAAMLTGWGEPGDIALAGDWNGDGIDEPGVFRPSTKTWYRVGAAMLTGWGEPGDQPIVGDWNGDGTDEPGVFRPSTKTWYRHGATLLTGWGDEGDIALAGDWNGDGIDEPGVFRPSTKTWYRPGAAMLTGWGEPGDQPIAGDWNGDGTDEPGVFRPSTKTWYRHGAVMAENWGEVGDQPIAGSF
ncbi:M23 family metallopeptidase [Saccharothrix syringae]|uniref:M23 family metallopeptidase n=1 Tax=Saccharothrix syringae TaxID=103733 RepID=UPI0014775B85|nr:M23 family metallopeptidase [Saccharothrix syringae]